MFVVFKIKKEEINKWMTKLVDNKVGVNRTFNSPDGNYLIIECWSFNYDNFESLKNDEIMKYRI